MMQYMHALQKNNNTLYPFSTLVPLREFQAFVDLTGKLSIDRPQ